jgi:hypothetical protein
MDLPSMLFDCRSADRSAYVSVDAHRDRERWNLVGMTPWRTSTMPTWNRSPSGIGRRRMCFSDVRPGVFPRSVAWLRRLDLGNAPNTPRGVGQNDPDLYSSANGTIVAESMVDSGHDRFGRRRVLE